MGFDFGPQQKVMIYLPQFKRLTHTADFGENVGHHGGVECPDLFPLPVNGGKNKRVMLVSINPGGPNGGSATQYFIEILMGKNSL